MTIEEIKEQLERCAPKVLSIFDNLLYNPGYIRGESEKLTREEIISKMKHAMSYVFADFYSEKADHCRRVIYDTEICFAYQIFGGRYSISEFIANLSKTKKLYYVAKNRGLFTGDEIDFQLYLKDIRENDRETYDLIKKESEDVNLEYDYSDIPQIEKDCHFLWKYVMSFLQYMVRCFEMEGDKDRARELVFVDLDNKRRRFKLRQDPIVKANMPSQIKGGLSAYDLMDPNSPRMRLDAHYLSIFDPENCLGGFCNYGFQEPIVILGDNHDCTVFHEMVHACKSGGGFRSAKDIEGDINNYCAFDEIFTDMNALDIQDLFFSVTGKDGMINPREDYSRYRHMECFVKKLVQEKDLYEVIKYAGFEGENSIKILKSYMPSIIDLINTLHLIEAVNFSTLQEIENLNIVLGYERKTSNAKENSEFLYQVAERMIKDNFDPMSFNCSDACRDVLLAIKNAYLAQEKVLQEFRTRRQNQDTGLDF